MPRTPSPLRTTLASIWTWSVLVLSVIITFPMVSFFRIVGWPFDRVNYVGGRIFRWIGLWTTWLTPRWKFGVRGTPPANPRLPYIVVANHESFSDILLLCHLPWEMKWLSKVELMRIPVLGWTMWMANDIPVKRGRAASAREAIAACRTRLAQHCSVMMFPEGTRSLTEELLPFKDGAFRLAIDAGVPVLPLAIHGTRDAIAKHDWRINPATAIVQILEPVSSEGKTTAALKQEVRERIEAARERMRLEAGS
ncbi:MAG: lysophospholipid acyltransferase family protein [Gemmatimonadota bacterium]